MTQRYYIVREPNKGQWLWTAYGGLLARLGFFTGFNYIRDSMSFTDADDCERNLRTHLSEKGIKPEVVRVVTI